MTVTVTEPAAIAVTATAENAYTVTLSTQDSISVTASIPNKGDKGDTGDPGEFTPVGIDKEIQYNDGGVLGADADLKWDKNNRTLSIGIPDQLPDNPLAIGDALDGWLQANINNTSESAEASCDWVATADNGTDSTNYADIGIDSSVYASDSYPAYGPNDGYFQVEGPRMLLNTLRAGAPIMLVTGGAENANIDGQIDSDGITLTAGRKFYQDTEEMATATNRPEIFYGTGSPPSATGLADGTLFFKYTP